MKKMIFVILTTILLASCVKDRVKAGRDLFHGGEVDVKASQSAGVIVIKSGTAFNPFEGNGRSCASCHRAENKFGMSEATRDGLSADDRFFYMGLDEDQALLKGHGLVHVIGDGLDEFRQTPALNELCTLCNNYGNCESLGLNSDRTSNLQAFSLGAVINHHARSPARQPGVDFVLPSPGQVKDLVDYMLSSDVCEGL
ncbi:MAG: hypothetical protein O7D34_02180 [Ignavibacteria bacterium]|nr:hypothetical protein [Ignavibacteria bacterium]